MADRNIVDAVQEVDSKAFLPGIQRDLVWEKDEICKLFDSVLQGYPFGSLVYWKKSEIREKQILYHFVRHKASTRKDSKLKNALSDVSHVDYSDVVSRNQEITGDAKTQLVQSDKDEFYLVIDGQQRLSAFYIGLMGTYSEKRSDKEWDAGEQLHLDVLSEPNRDGLSAGELRNQLKFADYGNVDFKYDSRAGRFWVRLGVVLDYYRQHGEEQGRMRLMDDAQNRFADLSDDEWFETTGPKRLNRLWTKLVGDKVLNIDTISGKKEQVLEAFVRINRQGEPLQKHEMFLSVLTSAWSEQDMNAKEEINKFCDRMNEEYTSGYSFNVDKTLKAMATCLDGMSAEYDIADFGRNNRLERAKDLWEYNGNDVMEGELQTAIRSAVEFLRGLGFKPKVMKQQFTSMLPVIYYFYVNKNAPTWDSGVRRKIEYFVCSALLSGDYSRRYAAIESGLKESIMDNKGDFPLDEIRTATKNSDYSPVLDEQSIREALSKSNMQGSGPAFAVYKLLYFPSTESSVNYEDDHLFPKDKFTVAELTNEGIPKWKAENLVSERRNSVANFELLPPEDNRDKEAMPLANWLSQQNDSYFERHAIPDSTPTLEHIGEFLADREDKIVRAVLDRFEESNFPDCVVQSNQS